MTETILDKGIAAIREASEKRQQAAAELLLVLADDETSAPPPRLTPEQAEGVKEAVRQADRGEFASEAAMAALWERCGL